MLAQGLNERERIRTFDLKRSRFQDDRNKPLYHTFEYNYFFTTQLTFLFNIKMCAATVHAAPCRYLTF